MCRRPGNGLLDDPGSRLQGSNPCASTHAAGGELVIVGHLIPLMLSENRRYDEY